LKRISIPLALLLTLVVAACSSGEGKASAAASAPPPTAEPTPEATSEASDGGDPLGSMGAIPSFDLDGDPELAARFPDTVDGQPLEIQSLSADAFAQMPSDPTFDEFLGRIGAEATDVSIAFGGADFGDSLLSVGAFRVRGASQDELQREFIAASQETGETADLSAQTIGGKDVMAAADPTGESDVRVFIYTRDDTLYFLTGSEAHAAEILEALP
jgi:hypothetical protein